MSIPDLVLASASPARLKLLQTAGFNPIVRRSNFDEAQIQLDNPIKLVETLALKKAEVVAGECRNSLILGCDSVLMVDDAIYGKPRDKAEAIARWQEMSHHRGTLYTGHALVDQTQGKKLLDCGITQVYFADLNPEMIATYVDSGEPLKCAGAFALEGKGGLFVERIEGCHSNVIGLSLPLFRKMLITLGYNLRDFWKSI